MAQATGAHPRLYLPGPKPSQPHVHSWPQHEIVAVLSVVPRLEIAGCRGSALS